MRFVELRVCLKEIIQQFSSPPASYIPYFLHVFFYVPLVSFSHMKLLFKFLMFWWGFLRDFAVLIGIYPTKLVNNSCASFCV